MRVLILGVGGMLGHKMWLTARERFDVWGTMRGDVSSRPWSELFRGAHLIEGVDAASESSVEKAIVCCRPEAVVNCIGVVKQRRAADDPIEALTVNALFPHQLARTCRRAGIRLVHVSTDCVFSGKRGASTEDDVADATDLYGRTKLLGEVHGDGQLTLRTSMVGRELGGQQGLIEWFLARNGGVIDGYRHAIFSGVTTAVLSRVICDVLESGTPQSGLFHVASEPISKFDLLTLVQDAFATRVQIVPADEPRIDRSLDGSRFRAATGFVAPGWPEMIRDMSQDPTPYAQWRTEN